MSKERDNVIERSLYGGPYHELLEFGGFISSYCVGSFISRSKQSLIVFKVR
jgi:hypothetical protein